MALNIKNQETHRLAQQLADLTGETMTAAVSTAIAERIERIQQMRSSSEIIKRVRQLIQKAGGREECFDHSDLYDENGLPK